MRTYIKPELEVTSIFAHENIASDPMLFLTGENPDGGSSIYIDNGGNNGGWDFWD